MLVEIYPPTLQSAGLRSAIEDLLSGLSARDITVDCEIPAELDVPAEAERLIFRVTQETLRNISKHSQAGHVAIRLESTPDRVTLTIADDGVGMDASTIGESVGRGHLGVRVMRDLAAAAGARLALASRLGVGTWLQLGVPLP